MNNLNTVLVEGTLTRDPNLKALSATSNMCLLSIANNRFFADKNGNWKQDTSFFLVQVYGKVAEICNKYLKKGRGIRVVGRLKQIPLYPENGNKHDLVVIIAEHIEFQPDKKKVEFIPEPEPVPGELRTTMDEADLETTVDTGGKEPCEANGQETTTEVPEEDPQQVF